MLDFLADKGYFIKGGVQPDIFQPKRKNRGCIKRQNKIRPVYYTCIL